MKTEYVYIRFIAALLLAVGGWGVAAPPLVSSPTDAGLVLGVAICLFVPLGIYWLIKPIIKGSSNTNLKTKEDEKK